MAPRVRTAHVQAPQRRRVRARIRALAGAVLAATLAGALLPAPARAQADSLSAPAPDFIAIPAASAEPPVAKPPRATAPDAVPAAKPAAAAPAPPADLRHVQEWVDYRAAAHLASLPDEARLFYRRGLMVRQAGQEDEAVLDVRGASELDPSFIEPHLTLASWTLVRDPSQALLHYATVVELLRQNFSLQLNLVANATILLLESVFAGLLFAAMLVAWLRRRELTHVWQEQLSRFASPRAARAWGPALAVLAYLAGFGWTLPTLFFLGVLWPHLRLRERALFALLLAATVTMPVTLRVVERMSLPLHEDAPPFYAVPTLENAKYDPAREARLAGLAAAHPANPILHFGLGWTARRGGRLAVAERAYRRAAELRPDDDRAWNNLGNVLAAGGRFDEALTAYDRAIAAHPASAAPHFNAAQIHTLRYDYPKANEHLQRASAVNFELVKRYQAQATSDGALPLADQWMTPRIFWKALADAPLPADLTGSLPVSLRRHVETSGWRHAVAAAVLALAGLLLGLRQQRDVPLRACGNCGAIVCRRCAERRREHALCETCVGVEAQGETAEFARVMLARHRFSIVRRSHLVRMALAMLLPGYGHLAQRRVFTAVALLAASTLMVRAWIGAPPPFAIEPRLGLSAQEVPAAVLLGGYALVLAVSVLGYLRLHARERARDAALAASQRGRITQASRRVTPEAA